jgi:hypothetical protein
MKPQRCYHPRDNYWGDGITTVIIPSWRGEFLRILAAFRMNSSRASRGFTSATSFTTSQRLAYGGVLKWRYPFASSILDFRLGFSIRDHLFWGTTIYENHIKPPYEKATRNSVSSFNMAI